MKHYTLQASERTMVGRRVKHMRKAGKIPATVYGKTVPSATLVVDRDAFLTVYKQAGVTGLIQLSVGTETRPVLVHHIQVHPVSDEVLHVEFHQVDLKEKVHAKVPLVIIGESPAVAEKAGVLLTILDSVEVEALPTALPDHIDVDVSVLAEVNAELRVSDLSIDSDVTMMTDGAQTIVKIGALVSHEAETQAAAESAAATEAASAEVAAEGSDTSTDKTPSEKTEEK